MKAYIFIIENDIYPDSLKNAIDLKDESFQLSVLIDKKGSMAGDLENSPRKETGILSTLTQLLSLSSVEEENAQLEKAKHNSLARECIEKCQLERINFISG